MTDISSQKPLVLRLAVSAKPPSLQDNTGDVDRLKAAVANALRGSGLEERECVIPYQALNAVGAAFRELGFEGEAVLNLLPGRVEIVDFLPADGGPVVALALDLGTTHLEASLLDLRTGETLVSGHALNRQVRFGPDILSRIHAATGAGGRGGPGCEGVQGLQEEVVASINGLVKELAGKAGLEPRSIRAMGVSGNTTMTHFLLGANPYHICREPYIPLVNAPDPCRAPDLGLDIAPCAPVWIMPSIGSYFGGDLVSGILAAGLDEAEGVRMLIDVGTNAEVVLGNSEWLIACAGAAGPALESGVAQMGMRAQPGAIERVRIDTEKWRLDYSTIGDVPPSGICGSGLIDLAAELYLARILDFRGKLQPSGEEDEDARKRFLADRLRSDESGAYFIVAPESEAADGKPVVVGQLDIDAMMRSKAAMYAILSTLTGQVGVAFDQLERIYVAGAFGRHIDPHHAITLGMIPDLPLSIYEPVGNSSLRGAEMALLSEENRRRVAEIRRKVTYIELNVNQEFMIRFSGSRFIPHTDPSLFPSVPCFR
ncbi:MAG: ASKHA domain-containing protein [Desulfobulbaceae bacterium]